MDTLVDMIFGSGLTPITATVGALVIMCIMCFVAVIPISNIKSIRSQNSNKGFLEKEQRAAMIRNVTKIFETFNLKTIQSTTTEMMYYMCECTCKILQKVGIKKEVYVELDSEREAQVGCQVIGGDGKNDGTIDIVRCKYREVYKDTVTDKVLYEKMYPEAEINFSAVKSNNQNKSAAKFCTQCGAPMDVQGDFYHCNHCDAHYRTDAFSWTVSGMEVVDAKKQGFQTNMIGALIVGLVFISLVAQFLMRTSLNLIVYGIDLALIAGVGTFFWSTRKKLQGLIDCKEYDTHFSRDDFQRRILYLLKLYDLSKDLDIAKIEPFMDRESYQKLCAENVYDDFYYLDLEFKKMEIPSFKVEGGKQWIECNLTVDRVTVNEKKKIRKKRATVKMVLVRDEHCMTEYHNMADMVICEQCHSNINTAIDGTCKYCGAKIDMEKQDWCIYKIQE